MAMAQLTPPKKRSRGDSGGKLTPSPNFDMETRYVVLNFMGLVPVNSSGSSTSSGLQSSFSSRTSRMSSVSSVTSQNRKSSKHERSPSFDSKKNSLDRKSVDLRRISEATDADAETHYRLQQTMLDEMRVNHTVRTAMNIAQETIERDRSALSSPGNGEDKSFIHQMKDTDSSFKNYRYSRGLSPSKSNQDVDLEEDGVVEGRVANCSGGPTGSGNGSESQSDTVQGYAARIVSTAINNAVGIVTGNESDQRINNAVDGSQTNGNHTEPFSSPGASPDVILRVRHESGRKDRPNSLEITPSHSMNDFLAVQGSTASSSSTLEEGAGDTLRVRGFEGEEMVDGGVGDGGASSDVQQSEEEPSSGLQSVTDRQLSMCSSVSLDDSPMSSSSYSASTRVSLVSTNQGEVQSLINNNTLTPVAFCLQEDLNRELERTCGTVCGTPTTPESEVARILGQIGDSVQFEYGDILERVTVQILNLPEDNLNYDDVRHAAENYGLTSCASGWKKVALLLLLSQRIAFGLLSRGNRGIGRIADHTVRLIEDYAADFILQSGGWSAITELDSVSPVVPIDPNRANLGGEASEPIDIPPIHPRPDRPTLEIPPHTGDTSFPSATSTPLETSRPTLEPPQTPIQNVQKEIDMIRQVSLEFSQSVEADRQREARRQLAWLLAGATIAVLASMFLYRKYNK